MTDDSAPDSADLEAAAAAAASLEENLCAWEEFYDDTNEALYYYNAETGESSWEVPPDYFAPASSFTPTGEGAGEEKARAKKVQPLAVSRPVMLRKDFVAGSGGYAAKFAGKWITEGESSNRTSPPPPPPMPPLTSPWRAFPALSPHALGARGFGE